MIWTESLSQTDNSNRGRTAGCPTAPSQIPACGTTAPGSSGMLAFTFEGLLLVAAISFNEVSIMNLDNSPVDVSFEGCACQRGSLDCRKIESAFGVILIFSPYTSLFIEKVRQS
jgi:hypothetical protein